MARRSHYQIAHDALFERALLFGQRSLVFDDLVELRKKLHREITPLMQRLLAESVSLLKGHEMHT
jgi:hypothetical protein